MTIALCRVYNHLYSAVVSMSKRSDLCHAVLNGWDTQSEYHLHICTHGYAYPRNIPNTSNGCSICEFEDLVFTHNVAQLMQLFTSSELSKCILSILHES